MNQSNQKRFRSIELFAGAGGLALGIEKAGFETIGLVEIDKDAAGTLRLNRPHWNVINQDIAELTKLDLTDYFGIKKGALDLLSGGAPCQSFSYAGKRLGLEDARGTLFYHYGRIPTDTAQRPAAEPLVLSFSSFSCTFDTVYT